MSILEDAARRYKAPMPDADVRALVKAAQNGDRRARDRIIVENVRFVMSHAKRYFTRPGSQEDLLQVGCMGLNHAIDRYDFRANVKFLSYAMYWIKAWIQNFVIAETSMIRIGTTQAHRALMWSIGPATRRLEKAKQEITPTSIAKLVNRMQKTKVTERHVEDVQALMKGELSLNAKVNHGDDDAFEHLDHLTDGRPLPEEELSIEEDSAEAGRMVRLGLGALDERERDIFQARFLADTENGRGETLGVVGERHGFSRERARQLEKRGMEKFKRVVEDNMGEKLNGSDGMQERLSRIAKKDAKERHCPKCKRDNALRRDFVDGKFVYKCRWRDCQAVIESQ